MEVDMKICPVCNHKLYGEQGKGRFCKLYGDINDLNYLRRKNGQSGNEKKEKRSSKL